MKKIKLSLKLLFIISFYYVKVHAQSVVSEKTFGDTDMDGAFDIKTLPNGDFIIAGNKGSVGTAGFGSGDIYLLKLNTNGDTIWTKTYGTKYDESANSIALLTDGGFAVTGFESTAFTAASRNVFVMKLDANGNKLWKKTYGGNADDEGNEIKQTADGGFIVAGLTESYGAGNRDAYLIKINASGDTLWTKTFGKEKFDDSWDVELTSDGGYMLTGGTYSYASGTFDDAWLIKTDANGNKQWIKNYGVNNKVDWAWSLTPIRSGGFAFVGVKNSGEGNPDGLYGDLHFVKVDNDGNVVWDKSIHAEYRLEGTDIQETKDNGFIIGGFKITMEGQLLYMVKTNSTGDVLWDKTFGFSATLNRANGVAETRDGGFAVVGYRSEDFTLSTEDICFIKVKDDLANGIHQPGGAALNPVQVYPNPACNLLHVVSPTALQNISIYSLTGQLIMYIEALDKSIDVSHLPNGLYTVVLNTATGSTSQKVAIIH